jgi:DNA-binding NtrC family response regulator
VYHKEVEDFKRDLIARTIIAHGGNRTHAAKALGLQRTYLLRLIREFSLNVPPPTRAHRDGNG